MGRMSLSSFSRPPAAAPPALSSSVHSVPAWVVNVGRLRAREGPVGPSPAAYGSISWLCRRGAKVLFVHRRVVDAAPVAQRIEHLTTDQKVRGSNPFGCALC